jgi:hypothetical protein
MEVRMSVAAGRECVEQVADICNSLGYSVYVPERETCGPWDMKVNGMRVQVKSRCIDNFKPNCIRLKTNFGPATKAYSVNDIDAFVIRWDAKWYVVPSSEMPCAEGSIRNGIFMPDIGEWRDRWEVLDGDRVCYSQQKSFDF